MFVALVERALGGGVVAPCLAACGAAGVVAVEQPANDFGEQLAVGVFGFGVHGVGPVIVGQDHPEAVGSGVFGAAPQLMHVCAGDRGGVFVVGFAAEVGVDVGVVGVAAAAHGHVGEGPAGGFGDDDPAPAAAMLPPAPLPVAVSLAGELRRQRGDSPALSSV